MSNQPEMDYKSLFRERGAAAIEVEVACQAGKQDILTEPGREMERMVAEWLKRGRLPNEAPINEIF
jgi:hypothetical protein